MYPYPEYKYFGIHVKEQIDSLKNTFHLSGRTYFINGRRSKINYFTSIFKINYLVFKNKFDLIHVHFGLSGLFLLFNPFIKTPVVLTLHGSDVNTTNRPTKWIVRKVASKCRKVIIMNPDMSEKLNSFVKELEVIPCGVDLNFFKPVSKITQTKLRIGFPGDPARKEKNYTLFGDVAGLLNKNGYDVEEIIFHHLSRVEVVENLNKIDILLLTSLNEGSPQIIKEALACNTAVVSVPVGDVPKMLFNIQNSRVSKNYEADELYHNILQVISTKPLDNNFQGRERIKELNLDIESVATRIYHSYKEILND